MVTTVGLGVVGVKLRSTAPRFGAGEGDATPDALLKRADDALYEAKRGGRNRVIAVAG